MLNMFSNLNFALQLVFFCLFVCLQPMIIFPLEFGLCLATCEHPINGLFIEIYSLSDKRQQTTFVHLFDWEFRFMV